MTFTHIRIELVKEGPKTNQWVVHNKYEDVLIGHIKWFGRWRKYAFFPESGCVFEEVCMRELATFIQQQTVDHKVKHYKFDKPTANYSNDQGTSSA